MTIRRAEISDLEKVAKLFNDYRIFYKQSSDLSSATAFIKERLTQKDSVVFIAVNEQNHAMGFTQLYDSFTSVGMSKIWLLNDLYVDLNHRKKGIAEALMNAAKDHCISTGRPKIILETGNDNLNAQSLYKKLGYEQSSNFIYELVI